MRRIRSSLVCAVIAAAVLLLVPDARAEEGQEGWRARFAERVCAAAFGKEEMRSCDVLVLVSSVRKPMTPEQIREGVKGVYDRTEVGAVHPQGTPEGDAEMRAETERITRQQEEDKDKPSRKFRRIRISGEQGRIDEAVLPPDAEFRPDMPFDSAQIYADGVFIKYDHSHEQAYIAPSDNRGLGAYRNQLNGWLGVPPGVPIALVATAVPLFGKADMPNKRIVRDDEKVAKFVAGESPFAVSVRTETAGLDRPRDRVEIEMPGGGSGHEGRMVLLVDSADYAVVHELTISVYEGGEGVPPRMAARTRYEYDAKGKLKKLIREAYDEQGKLLPGSEEVTFLQLALNAPVQADTFTWAPPKGYLVTDKRGKEVSMYTQK
ncbi:MAG: hypothetical protein GXY55_13115 [Phycisphaerae bacterium]|nr:hypothetical protein [Phycisphaerae bacterium]